MWAFALLPFNASSDKGLDRRGFNKDGNIYETRRRRFMSPVNNAIYNQAWQPNTCLGLVKFACPMKTFNYFNNFVAFLHDWFTRLWGTTKIWTLQHTPASAIGGYDQAYLSVSHKEKNILSSLFWADIFLGKWDKKKLLTKNECFVHSKRVEGV